MASPDMMLICKIINEGSLKEAIEWGLSAEDFTSEETKGIFKQLLTTYMDPSTNGAIIGPHIAKMYFSHLPLHEVDPGITLSFLCKQVRERKLCFELAATAQAVGELAVAGMPFEAFARLQEGAGAVMRLDGGKNCDIDAATGLEQVLD